jgi:type VI protein secretion system component VasF
MFYYYAEFARGLDTPAALEVFAVCAALGFQGVYRENVLNRVHELANAVETTEESRRVLLSAAAAASADGARLPRSADVLNGLPREFQRWLAGVFVQLNGDTVHAYQPKSPPDSARDARPLTAASALTRWSALLTAGILICLILHSLDGFGVI